MRTCAVTGCELVLVRPLGFSLSDRWLKRAGLDYWEGVSVVVIDDLETYLEECSVPFYFFSSKAKIPYTDVQFSAENALVFGSETTGLPKEVFERWPERALTIPMLPGKRCLNLATSVGIGVYEAWRQLSFSTEEKVEEQGKDNTENDRSG